MVHSVFIQTIPGVNGSSITSLAWFREDVAKSRGRLFSAGLNGNITEWDLKTLMPKVSTRCSIGSYPGEHGA